MSFVQMSLPSFSNLWVEFFFANKRELCSPHHQVTCQAVPRRNTGVLGAVASFAKCVVCSHCSYERESVSSNTMGVSGKR